MEKKHSKNIMQVFGYLKEGDKVLDLGCGSGRDSVFLAEKGFHVWGVDILERAIEKAKQRSSLKNPSFSLADAENLPFEAGFFDAVYSNWVLQFLPLKKVHLEIARVLKKEGIAFLAFLLDTKIIDSGKVKRFHNKEEILAAFKEFKILKQDQGIIKELFAEEPHTHNVFILVLRKTS